MDARSAIKSSRNCNQYFLSRALCMDNHVSNAINTDGKCTVMVCLSVSAKRHDNFRFVSAYLHRKTRKEPANRLVKNGGPVDYSKHSESISLTLNSFRSDGFVDVLDRLLFK